MKETLNTILNFLIDNWETDLMIGLALYELLARLIKSEKNRSILDFVFKVIALLLPNRDKNGNRHIVKIIIFFMLISGAAFAQTNTVSKGWASVNADSAVFRSVINNLQNTYTNVGGMYYNRESNKWRVFENGVWKDLFSSGGGGSGIPSAPLQSIQFNNAGAFGGSELFKIGTPSAPIDFSILLEDSVGNPTVSINSYDFGGQITLRDNVSPVTSTGFNPQSILAQQDFLIQVSNNGAGSEFQLLADTLTIGNTNTNLVRFETPASFLDNSTSVERFRINTNGTIQGRYINISDLSSNYAVILGDAAERLSGNGNIALGWRATSHNSNVISIGLTSGYASTGGINGINIGVESNFNRGVLDQDYIAIGAFTGATARDAIAIGTVAEAKSGQQISIGYRAGNTTGTHGQYSTSLGYHANWGTANIGSYSIGIGQVNTTATGSFLLGYRTLGSDVVTNSTANSFGLGWDSATPDILFAKTSDSYINNSTAGLVLGGSTVNASAKFQIDSTTKGFLPPRMTGAQAEAIISPAEGLMIYSTDGSGVTINSKGWWGYDGTTWVKFN